MKRLTLFVLLGLSLILTACNLSLVEDVTPPPGYISPTPPPTLGPLFPAAAPDLAKGKDIYATECAPCHGNGGLGDGPMNGQLSYPVAAIGLPDIARKASPSAWYTVVTQGNMARMMPPFSNKLSVQERWDVVAYALSLHATPAMIQQGQALFEKNCADCSLDFFTSQEKMSSLSDDDLISLMLQGSDAFPAFGANLNQDELYSVAAYLRSLTFAAAASETGAAPAAEGTPAAEAYPNATETTAAPAAGVGTVRGKLTFPGGTVPADFTVTLRGYDHAQDSSGPQETLTLEGSVNSDGSFTFENVEMPENRILMAEANYKGILYQSELSMIKAGESAVELAPLTLYDTSTDLTALTVDQGHVFLDVSTGQVQIIEFISILNSTGKTILVPVTSDTMALAVAPAGTTSLGYDAQQGQTMPVQAQDGGFAMPPSDKSYGLVAGFQMPYDNKSAEVEIPFALGMPANSSIFVPVGVKLAGNGLTDQGPQDIGNGTVYQVYGFGPLSANSSLTVKMSGQPQTGEAAGGTSTNSNQPLIIGVGLLGILLIGAGGWLYFRDRKRSEETDEEHDDEDEFDDADSVLDAIIALDDLHRAGKLPDEAYQNRRAELKEQLKKLESRD
jgi:mono/diheme cytochrome c family protein